MFKRIPEVMHAQCNLVLRNQVALAIDTIIRYEPAYMLIRGREGGTTDEGRSFFVPFEDIAYIKVERILKVGDLKRMYGETSDVDEDKLAPRRRRRATPRPTSRRRPRRPRRRWTRRRSPSRTCSTASAPPAPAPSAAAAGRA